MTALSCDGCILNTSSNTTQKLHRDRVQSLTSIMSQFCRQNEPPEGYLKYYLGHLVKHGQKLLVYPGAFTYGPVRHPQDLPMNPMSKYGIPCLRPLLQTPDGAELACFLLLQTSNKPNYHHPIQMRSSTRNLHEILENQKEKQEQKEKQREEEEEEITPAAGDARATVLMFLGNAAQNWEEMHLAKRFWGLGCNVLLVSYRGYGFSTGTPSEEGLQTDAQAALDYVLSEPYLAQTPIILHGYSLGGAVAVHLASQNPSKITALIISNTFPSLPSLLRSPSTSYRFFRPFATLGLCTQKWDSERKMEDVERETRVLMISGRKDGVVPPMMMDRLWEAVRRRGRGRGKGQKEGKEKGKGVWDLWRWRGWGRCKGNGVAKEVKKGYAGSGGVCGSIKKRWKCLRGLKSTSGSEDQIEESIYGALADDRDIPTEDDDVFVEIPDGTHEDTETLYQYWAAIGDFIRTLPVRRRRVDKSLLGSTHKRRWENQGGNLVAREGVQTRVVVLP